jgi:hypothetical protein
MAEHEDRTAQKWSNLAWLVLVAGVVLVVWGVSMGFTRYGPGRIPHTNVEAIVRVVAGGALILSSVVLAALVAPRLSRLERRLWMVVMGVTVFVGSYLLAWTAFPYDSVCNPPGTSVSDDIDCAFRWGFVFLLVAIGVSIAVLVAVSAWSRSRQASEPEHRHHAQPE